MKVFLVSLFFLLGCNNNPIDHSFFYQEPLPPPIPNDVAVADFLAGTGQTITLSFTAVDGATATFCDIPEFEGIYITEPCVCEDGVCTVGINGEPGYVGEASFSFTVGARVLESEPKEVNFDLLCPSGYLTIKGNDDLDSSDFCVMQFEAKCSGATCNANLPIPPSATATAVSAPGGFPWVYITPDEAQTACTNLGEKYNLIANIEWLTIAREIENEPANWFGLAVGSGMLNRGNSSGFNGIPVTNVNDAYNGTGSNAGQAPGAGWEQKRNWVLDSDDEVIWDFAGNIWEIVDWSTEDGFQGVTNTQKAYSAQGMTNTWVNFTALVGSSRVDLQACKLEYSIVSPK